MNQQLTEIKMLLIYSHEGEKMVKLTDVEAGLSSADVGVRLGQFLADHILCIVETEMAAEYEVVTDENFVDNLETTEMTLAQYAVDLLQRVISSYM